MNGRGICRVCREPVIYTRTEAGRTLAVDAEPTDRGNTAVHRNGLGAWLSRRPTGELPLSGFERLYMPHPPARCQAPAAELPVDVVSLDAYRRRRASTRPPAR